MNEVNNASLPPYMKHAKLNQTITISLLKTPKSIHKVYFYAL